MAKAILALANYGSSFFARCDWPSMPDIQHAWPIISAQCRSELWDVLRHSNLARTTRFVRVSTNDRTTDVRVEHTFVSNAKLIPTSEPEPSTAESSNCEDSPEFPFPVLAGDTPVPREEPATSEEEQQLIGLDDLEVHRENVITEQLRDPTLLRARENVVKIDVELVNPDKRVALPYFIIISSVTEDIGHH